MIKGTSTSSLASISVPPWPGGVSPQARTTRTSPTATTSTSWSVAELLDQHHCCPPPEGLDSNDGKSVARIRRHFHRLFCQLKFANSRSHRDVLWRDLGHFDNLGMSMSKNRRVSGSCSTICGTSASGICTMGATRTNAPQCAAGPAPAADARREPRAATRRQAHLRRPEKNAQCLPPGGRGCSSRTWPCSTARSLSPPLPSSVSVELSGAYTRQGPGRSTAAHAAKQHVVATLSDAEQFV